MTTHELIATLRQGVPVTARLVREIIIHLERLAWAERSLKAALEKYGNDTGAVKLSAEESAWVCDGLDAHNALREAVAWMVECDAVKKWIVFDCECFFGDNTEEITESAAFAREMVGRMV